VRGQLDGPEVDSVVRLSGGDANALEVGGGRRVDVAASELVLDPRDAVRARGSRECGRERGRQHLLDREGGRSYLCWRRPGEPDEHREGGAGGWCPASGDGESIHDGFSKSSSSWLLRVGPGLEAAAGIAALQRAAPSIRRWLLAARGRVLPRAPA